MNRYFNKNVIGYFDFEFLRIYKDILKVRVGLYNKILAESNIKTAVVQSILYWYQQLYVMLPGGMAGAYCFVLFFFSCPDKGCI